MARHKCRKNNCRIRRGLLRRSHLIRRHRKCRGITGANDCLSKGRFQFAQKITATNPPRLRGPCHDRAVGADDSENIGMHEDIRVVCAQRDSTLQLIARAYIGGGWEHGSSERARLIRKRIRDRSTSALNLRRKNPSNLRRRHPILHWHPFPLR